RLNGTVALVTGASHGGWKGIALVLGEEGATVYVTGRSVRGESTTLGRPGTIDDTADEVTARGGTGIAVRCDHTDDAQVEALFDRIRREHGALDLLVNNAWSGYELSPDPSLAFWEIEWRHWDLMFAGGLRAPSRRSFRVVRWRRSRPIRGCSRSRAACSRRRSSPASTGSPTSTGRRCRRGGASISARADASAVAEPFVAYAAGVDLSRRD